MCKVKGDTHITALSNNGAGEWERFCKVRDNNRKRKTFNIGSNFAFICECVNKSTVIQVFYALTAYLDSEYMP